jgi:hypothetical protein
MKSYRHRQVLVKKGMDVSLFPFLSIFLCVMGVLSFLNILNATVGSRQMMMTGEVAQGYKIAYQILCSPEGIILVPPVEQLPALRGVLPVSEQPRLDGILQQRQQQRSHLTKQPNEFKQLAPNVVEQIFADVDFLNRQARIANFLYEEFILFGIYPNGAKVYHNTREVLSKKFSGIRVGLEALDNNWKPSVTSPSKGTKQP